LNFIRTPAALLCVALLAGCGSVSKLWDSVVNPSAGAPPAAGADAASGARSGGSSVAATPVPVRPAPAPPVAPPPTSAQAVTAVTTALSQGEARPVLGTGANPSAPNRSDAAAPRPLGGLVYFDFDSFDVRAEAQALIESHAQVLRTDRSRRVVVEGHADERGGREYNLSLGQKRAEAVRQALITLGANDYQLEAVSFGEERPAVPGSDEAAWAKNRRAELKERR
jgi:peptidoglycan-associated lipoprotein